LVKICTVRVRVRGGDREIVKVCVRVPSSVSDIVRDLRRYDNVLDCVNSSVIDEVTVPDAFRLDDMVRSAVSDSENVSVALGDSLAVSSAVNVMEVVFVQLLRLHGWAPAGPTCDKAMIQHSATTSRWSWGVLAVPVWGIRRGKDVIIGSAPTGVRANIRACASTENRRSGHS
jgi:hypothetical protein